MIYVAAQTNQSNLPLVRALRPLVKTWREWAYLLTKSERFGKLA
ncbi:MAG: hypothetical protein U1A25_00865 [Candidatus Sungbacteria bacterium]|nr:hypothetical protein [Candidatus Sungbacteria bacterium]